MLQKMIRISVWEIVSMLIQNKTIHTKHGQQIGMLGATNTWLAVSMSSCPLHGGVSLHVEGEVVWPGESSVAQLAVEGPVPGVLPLVPGQLVAAGEPPAAARPAAHVGLLPGVGADVGL